MIFYISSWPGGPSGITVAKVDKILHMIEFMPFGFLLGRAIAQTFAGFNLRRVLFFIFLGSFIYGVSDEFHQFFVPGREASFLDVLADSAGGLLGGIFYCILNKSKFL